MALKIYLQIDEAKEGKAGELLKFRVLEISCKVLLFFNFDVECCTHLSAILSVNSIQSQSTPIGYWVPTVLWHIKMHSSRDLVVFRWAMQKLGYPNFATRLQQDYVVLEQNQ